MIHHYEFWLITASLAVFILERIWPWRKEQPVARPQLIQDLFWIILNGWALYFVLDYVFECIRSGLNFGFFSLIGQSAASFQFISGFPLLLQVIVVLVIGDFVEWCVHNLLHRISWLWSFHRLHHSIHVMDWLGNWRFSWMEIIVYKTFKYLPLALLGARWETLLITSVISTIIGNLNHSNLFISWGPLRYLFNSPRMHIWHHDKFPANNIGYNFAIVFSLWDWLFGTAYMPMDKSPKALGFYGDERFPHNVFLRLFVPFLNLKSRKEG
jgi:sterol desaturase/sphingolipid hydroxylase (fatty acid hydroxylase superfamily)